MSKVWLVTGCSRGLGRAIASAVADAGERLIATARDPKDLQPLVDAHPDHVRAVALDVTDSHAARAAVAAAVDNFGRLDVLVNNAGYANIGSFEDVSEADFRAQFEADFFGVVNVTKAALPVMRKQRAGHIIQISSIGGRGASPGLSAYQSAKWAVGGLSGVIAKEVAPFGVHVTTVEPGGMRTDWAGSSMKVDDLAPDYRETIGNYSKFLRGAPEVMRGDPRKIAQVILRLAEQKEPPLRLLIGTDAVFLAKLYLDQRRDEDAKWRAWSASTDFDGMPDFATTPAAKRLEQGPP